MQPELEIKVLGIEVQEFEQRILDSGGIFIGHERQENLLFAPEALKNTHSYLRIRKVDDLSNQTQYAELTLKENTECEHMRVNHEYTVPLEDPEIMIQILTKIGCGVPEGAKKYRKRYQLLSAIVEIDQWEEDAYPDPYAEIEVESADDLQAVLTLLQITPDQVSTQSIKQLMDEKSASAREEPCKS